MGNLAIQRIAEGYTFLYAFEDAIGFMIFDICLDKDGVRAAGMFSELANSLYAQGTNINQHLDSLYEKSLSLFLLISYLFSRSLFF